MEKVILFEEATNTTTKNVTVKRTRGVNCLHRPKCLELETNGEFCGKLFFNVYIKKFLIIFKSPHKSSHVHKVKTKERTHRKERKESKYNFNLIYVLFSLLYVYFL